jgi:hypothetical protein
MQLKLFLVNLAEQLETLLQDLQSHYCQSGADCIIAFLVKQFQNGWLNCILKLLVGMFIC